MRRQRCGGSAPCACFPGLQSSVLHLRAPLCACYWSSSTSSLPPLAPCIRPLCTRSDTWKRARARHASASMEDAGASTPQRLLNMAMVSRVRYRERGNGNSGLTLSKQSPLFLLLAVSSLYLDYPPEANLKAGSFCTTGVGKCQGLLSSIL